LERKFSFPKTHKYHISYTLQCYWSIRDGNGTVTWADARITENGIAQAQKANAFWASHIISQKIPVPETYYTSPLTRCLETANVTFFGLDLPSRKPFVPTVKELFREGISGHTCDRRGTKTYIHDAFPAYKIEPGFSENDLLWKPLQGEVQVDENIRSKTALDEVFSSDDSTYISITSHSGEIASILQGMGRFLLFPECMLMDCSTWPPVLRTKYGASDSCVG
jgi:broad specificity phosphatase PhoE